MSEFQSILKELRKMNNMTQEDMSKKLGVSKQVISNWERGYTTSISPDMLQMIAKVFNTTTEFMLGINKDNLTERYNNEFGWKYPTVSNRLGTILNNYRIQKGLSEHSFSELLNINTKTYIGIEIGKYTPSLKLLKKISEITKYDIDYLTGAKDHTAIPTDKILEINGHCLPVNDFISDYHFRARFEELCHSKELEQTDIAAFLGLTNEEYIDIRYNRMPTLSELLKISYALGVSMDYLIGKTDIKLSSLNSDELNLILNYRDCLSCYKENISKRAKELSIESIAERKRSSVAADEPLKRTGTDNLGK